MKQDGLIPIDIKSLYTSRVVILIEMKPQSNEYKQVLLNPEEFKKVSLHLAEMFQRPIDPSCVKCKLTCHEKHAVMNISDRDIFLPDDMQSVHRCTGQCNC